MVFSSQFLLVLVLLAILTISSLGATSPASCSATNQSHPEIQYLDDSDFLIPQHLDPGQSVPLAWRSDNKLADPDARIIGLPPELTAEVRAFAERIGLIEAFRMPTFAKPGNISSQILDLPKARGKWAVSTPSSLGPWAGSNMRWFDALDEDAYEETLQVLARGGFDTVLEAIGSDFNSEGLMIFGLGFVTVSKSNGAGIHADLVGSGHAMFDVLFPIVLPQHDAAQLYIGDKRNLRRVAPVNYTFDQAVLISGDTRHATGDCDYHQHGELRVTASVYIADVNKENVDLVAGDETSLFPVTHSSEWFLAQKGRAWGGGNSMKNDKGRKPFTAQDRDDRCPELAAAGLCDEEPWAVRPACPRSCNIFIDDERYFYELNRLYESRGLTRAHHRVSSQRSSPSHNKRRHTPSSSRSRPRLESADR